MKRPSLYSLLSFALLISCNGCKKQPEVEGETIPQAPACLIATQTTKELVSASQPSQLELETVTIKGESFQVSTTKKSTYSYDANGRILSEYNVYYAGPVSDSVIYDYKPGSVTIRTITFVASGKLSNQEAVKLNKQGLAENIPDGSQATYDQEGYFLTYRNKEGKAATVQNGNIIKNEIVGHDGTPNSVFKYKYDFSKTALPSIRSFYGNTRSLRTAYTIDEKHASDVYPEVYLVDYYYAFDERNRIMRQIKHGKKGNGPVTYAFGGNPITVTDFTYICP